MTTKMPLFLDQLLHNHQAVVISRYGNYYLLCDIATLVFQIQPEPWVACSSRGAIVTDFNSFQELITGQPITVNQPLFAVISLIQ